MEKIKVGLLEVIDELNELLDMSNALDLPIQAKKLGSMVSHVSEAINFLDKEDIKYVKVNDGNLYVKYDGKGKSKLYLSELEVISLYSAGGYIYTLSDGEEIILTKDEILECFEE